MGEVGLIASDTGAPGGKRCGQRMSHYIAAGGPFDRACAELLSSGFVIPYAEIISQADRERRELMRRRLSRAASKTTYVCPNHVEVRAWAKRGLLLKCGLCEQPLESWGFAGREEEWSAQGT